MKELLQKTREYLDYIEEHYDNVQKAWKIVQEKCKDMHFITDDFIFLNIDRSVKAHDASKLSKEEFIQYRKKFFPIEDEVVNKEDFNNAWENHKNENDHHWQTWVKAANESETNSCDFFIVHNVIDWMAMGMKFDDTAQLYYEKNKDKIEIPDWAEKFIYEIFNKLEDKEEKCT